MKRSKVSYVADDIDKDIEIWTINDIETWVGYGLEEIIKSAVEQTGVPEEELVCDPRKVPRHLWDKGYVIDSEEQFHPRYTYSNMIMKDMINGVDMPYMLMSSEY